MTIRASDRLSDLIGIGAEWLMDKEGNIRLEFFDGNIVRSNSTGNRMDTFSLS